MILTDLGLADFDAFYQIILNNFPGKEIKDYEYMLSTFKAGEYQVKLLRDNDLLIGILSYYQSSDFVMVDYFAIDQQYQGQGLGKKMLESFKALSDKMIILEVEHPTNDQSKRRIAFYQRCGFKLNDSFDYYVPPVRSLKHRLYFHLMSSPRYLSAAEYKKYYPQILALIYGICPEK